MAAAGGDAAARARVEGRFDAFRQGDWQIVDAIQRIWAGERDAEALTAGIDYDSRAIVLAILARLSGEAPASAPTAAPDPPRASSAALQPPIPSSASARSGRRWWPPWSLPARAMNRPPRSWRPSWRTWPSRTIGENW